MSRRWSTQNKVTENDQVMRRVYDQVIKVGLAEDMTFKQGLEQIKDVNRWNLREEHFWQS